MPTLYIVGTPIGNLEDLTYRAARVLGQVSLVAAEDTRITRKLLNHLGLRVPLTSYHQHNQQARLPELLAALQSGDVALVTDAGMPGISDPGSELAAQAAAAGFPVEVIPGVSAVTTALAASGLPADSFFFLGFLPRRGEERRARLTMVSILPDTLVIFEAPHRLQATLQDLLAVLGDRHMAVCRELTKLHQEVFRGSISQAIQHFQTPRGEFTLVVAGAGIEAVGTASEAPNLDAARQELARLRQSGARAREAVAQVSAALGIPRKLAYQLWLETGDHPHPFDGAQGRPNLPPWQGGRDKNSPP
ncbi:MAG: 16S rRNA (cytidine(1402)-2'-O)-methyltransferase [SAR202 cluster bacterium]|nr:16S rRNA (cytidine(1402)-2'-O)-methyltransferase [SAR202 cluster bacterium]